MKLQGIGEVVVKNGSGVVSYSVRGEAGALPTPRVEIIFDTTGAGDSFNAGYHSVASAFMCDPWQLLLVFNMVEATLMERRDHVVELPSAEKSIDIDRFSKPWFRDSSARLGIRI